MINKNRSKKILFLFFLLLLAFVLFLSVMFMNALKSRKSPSLYTSSSTKAQRGSIISADGFHIATTKKLYKAMLNTKNIDPEKKELFIELFSIYSGMDQNKIRKKINSRQGTIVLSYQIGPKVALYLKSLAFELLKYKVFVEYEGPHGERILQGLSIIESGETRLYPYGKLLTPLIGYPQKIEDDGYTRVYGVKGIEKSFEEELSAQKDGKQFALRDVNSYMILNRQSFTQAPIHGYDIKLNIPVTLQIKVEQTLEHYKEELQAKEISIILMESKSGKIISLGSSNRFFPKDIQKRDYPSLNTSAIEYSFEPGSVIKPITFALLLDQKLINPYDLVSGHNGRYKIDKKIITDEHKFDWMGAEDVIIYSSNIGIAQLSQKLKGIDFYDGFKKFGLTQYSGLDLPYERKGNMPYIRQLNHDIYKATTGYGYGMRSNLMQLVKAYNIFNNNGRIITPYIVEGFFDHHGRLVKTEHEKALQVISTATAQRMKKILVKTVNQGTGIHTRTQGIQIGGKTGTAHIAEKGHYVNKYNSSFIGFANDASKKYTLGVTVIEPGDKYFASQTAVPVFKAIIDILIDEAYLTPDYKKFPLPLYVKKH
ncbi:MAG: penicillin-binding protein 2 [Campylobacterota bacterium]|nr:penicillin-binding protein 2 [Campylobacterota bacterium]